MPKILFDCERMKYPNTGLFSFCHELGSALVRKADACEMLYFYMPKELGRHFGPNACYVWQNSLHKFFLRETNGIDIWHTTYQSSPYRSRKKGMHKVLTIHDLNFLHEGKTKDKQKRYLAAIQQNIDDADRIVTISQFAREEVLKYLDARGKQIHVIHNGASVREFPEFDSPRYRPARPYFFAMGTVLPKKNFHVLPRLLQHIDAELIIAGNINHAYCELIMAEAQLYKVADKVKVTGPVSDEEKYWYLKNCKAFLFPSLAEGFGLPVIEAMYFGKPVFLSDRTSLPEIGGDAAYYFHDFDAAYMQDVLEKGLTHHEHFQRADAVRKHAEKFNWNDAAAAYLDIYRSLY